MSEPAAELGRYQILGEIGRGSSGVVYHGRDTLLGREVALKSVRPPAAADGEEAEDLRGELLREAQNAGMLSHPNVVTVYDVLEGADGTLYIAMEYVEGRSLADVLAESGPLDLERAVDLVSHIASALDYLHAMGVVHRDVKPANILITRNGRVKLTDFGIAVSARGPRSEPGPSPGKGPDGEWAVLGTPRYMAPEQILGREISPQTDVWSLGIVLFEMLAGRCPFDGRGVGDVVHQIMHDPVPELEGRKAHPPRLRELLERALAKDARWRFRSAGDLARELRRILYEAAGEVAASLSETEMLDRTVVASWLPLAGRKRSNWPRGAVAAVLVAGLLGVAAFGAARLLRDRAGEGGPLAAEATEGDAAHSALLQGTDGAGGVRSTAREGGLPSLAGRTRITVKFSSDAPEGVLTIYGGGEQLLQRGFSYSEPGWLFGRKPSSGGFDEDLVLPPGVIRLWVYVARPGDLVDRIEVPVSRRPGASRALRVHVPAEGDVTAGFR